MSAANQMRDHLPPTKQIASWKPPPLYDTPFGHCSALGPMTVFFGRLLDINVGALVDISSLRVSARRVYPVLSCRPLSWRRGWQRLLGTLVMSSLGLILCDIKIIALFGQPHGTYTLRIPVHNTPMCLSASTADPVSLDPSHWIPQVTPKC